MKNDHKKTNAERIKGMNAKEMANFLFDMQVKAIAGFLKIGEQGVKHKKDLLHWLCSKAKEGLE